MASGPVTPKIRVITTGGTIASRLDLETGAVYAAASGEELVELVPALADVATIELEPFATVNGWNVTPPMMFALAERAAAALAQPDVAGVVITHGTDTVEETAYLLDLLLPAGKPVVFAVAMRNLSEVGSDGPRNLLDAVRVAASPAARGHGVLLVLNETVHAARHVTKTHTTNPAAFESPDYGPAALLTERGPRFLHPPAVRPPIPATRIEPEVLLVKVTAGADDRVLRWALAAGYRGLVIEGSGAGNVPAAVVPGIAAAGDAGVPVVLTSRCLRGFLSPTYGSAGAAGGGRDLLAVGVIPADHLPAQKARIKLMVALGATSDLAEIRRLFAEH